MLEDLEWEDPPRGYYISDVKQKTLDRRRNRSPMGSDEVASRLLDKKHTHPKANQLAFAVAGPNGGKGASVTKKGEVHGASVIKEEMLVLFYWDGPPDPEQVE